MDATTMRGAMSDVKRRYQRGCRKGVRSTDGETKLRIRAFRVTRAQKANWVRGWSGNVLDGRGAIAGGLHLYNESEGNQAGDQNRQCRVYFPRTDMPHSGAR